jgi:hypothetical protein
VYLDDYLTATIPAPSTIESAKDDVRESLIRRRNQALEWLRSNGHGDIIKSIISVMVPRGRERDAHQVLDAVSKAHLTAQTNDQVHPSTLKSFVREQLKNGANIPFDVFGIVVGKFAKIDKKGK